MQQMHSKEDIMKQYNTPEIEMVALQATAIVTVSLELDEDETDIIQG